MTTNLLATLALAASLLAGCTAEKINDVRVTLSYADAPYTELQVSSAINVTVDTTADSIRVTIGESIKDRLIVAFEEHTLKIRLRNNTVSRSDINVVLPANSALREVDLSGASTFNSPLGLKGNEVQVELSGASNFATAGLLDAGKLSIELSGASGLKADVAANRVEADLSGASDAKLKGQADQIDLEMSGASTFGTKDFSASDAEVDLSGASDATFTCTATLRGELSGGSTLNYYGNPTVSVNTTGGSELNRR